MFFLHNQRLAFERVGGEGTQRLTVPQMWKKSLGQHACQMKGGGREAHGPDFQGENTAVSLLRLGSQRPLCKCFKVLLRIHGESGDATAPCVALNATQSSLKEAIVGMGQRRGKNQQACKDLDFRRLEELGYRRLQLHSEF